MIKRTIEISREPAHLAVKLDQLLVERYPQTSDPPDQPPKVASIPCEDIGIVMVDHGRCTYSHAALSTLMRFGAAVVVCGSNHLPAGLLLPMNDHSECLWRIQDQLAASEPTKKRLWQQIVQAKIRAQAMNLPVNCVARGRLMQMIREVKSGDTTNVEAQAAKTYWSAWLADTNGVSALSFRRDTDGTDVVNAMLNYGYAVIRASVARAIVSTGLLPALGLHHANRGNNFCLADDLVEPLRPLIDRRVRDLHRQGRTELDQLTKAYLLEVLTETVVVESERGPFMVSLPTMTSSLLRCLQGTDKKILVPVATEDGR